MTVLIGLMGLNLSYWSAWPLDDHVRHRPLIVVGSITTIERASVLPGFVLSAIEFIYEPPANDVATIHITEVLKTSDATITAPGTVLLTMPALSRQIRRSTDVSFPVGATGVWMLTYQGGAWQAHRPDDLQDMGQLPVIRTHITSPEK